jgi:hypothetical protein
MGAPKTLSLPRFRSVEQHFVGAMGFGAKLCAEANQRDSALAVSHIQQRRLPRKVLLTIQPAAPQQIAIPILPDHGDVAVGKRIATSKATLSKKTTSASRGIP